jgi:hypothetical protein
LNSRPWVTLPALFCVVHFGAGGLRTICTGLALNGHPPALCLLSSQDYRREPPEPGLIFKSIFDPRLVESIDTEITRHRAREGVSEPARTWGFHSAFLAPPCGSHWGKSSQITIFFFLQHWHKWPFYGRQETYGMILCLSKFLELKQHSKQMYIQVQTIEQLDGY